MSKPKGDLSSLVLPKNEPQTTDNSPKAPMDAKSVKSLTVKVPSWEYARLIRYASQELERTGSKVTHQAIILSALSEYLDSKGAQ